MDFNKIGLKGSEKEIRWAYTKQEKKKKEQEKTKRKYV